MREEGERKREGREGGDGGKKGGKTGRGGRRGREGLGGIEDGGKTEEGGRMGWGKRIDAWLNSTAEIFPSLSPPPLLPFLPGGSLSFHLN